MTQNGAIIGRQSSGPSSVFICKVPPIKQAPVMNGMP